MGENDIPEDHAAHPEIEPSTVASSKSPMRTSVETAPPKEEKPTEEGVIEAVTKVVIPQLEKRLEEKQVRYTEVLGVFVALFTFVSINIQIFSKISSLNNALIFILLMFLCLGGFILLLHVILTAEKYPLIIIICGLVIAAIFIYLLPNTPLSLEESTELKQIDQRVSNLENTFKVLLQIRK